MAFVTRVRIEGAGESPDAIREVFDELLADLADADTDSRYIGARTTEEVFERSSIDARPDWYKGRRVVWFVEPGGANDPNAGKS